MLKNLFNKEFIICDGGLGTKIMMLGNEIPETYNITSPEKITDIHKQYLDAGSMAIETNSFGGSKIKLSKIGMENQTYEINSAAAKNAKKAAEKYKAYVLGSVGPTGVLPYPSGNGTYECYYNAFFPQIKGLCDADVDAIIIETMSCVLEAKAAFNAVKNINKNLPVFVSFTYSNGKTIYGTSAAVAAKTFTLLNADVIGANCTGNKDDYFEITNQYKANTHLPLSIMPNAGKPVISNGIINYETSIEEYLNIIKTVIKNGATILGGCCGTNEKFISALNKIIKNETIVANNYDFSYNQITSDRYSCSIEQIKNAPVFSPDIDELMDENGSNPITINLKNKNEDFIKAFLNELNYLHNPCAFICNEDIENIIKDYYNGYTIILF